jgi:hypothetical protein
MPSTLKLFLLLVKTRNPTNKIIVNTGIFVNMANPRRTPESRVITNLLLLFKLLVLTRSAKNTEDKKKDNWIPSSDIRISNDVIGITANRVDAINATFLL